MLCREITKCRICGSDALETVLDLGTHAISDFVDVGELPDFAPLELCQCAGCGLVQLRHTVDRDRLYRRYWYKSGTNETMVAALRDVVEDASSRVELRVCDCVLDIGSNDGTLLEMYPPHVYRYGFEPSDVAPTGRRNTTIWPEYFPPSFKAPSEWLGPKIITSIAMFYDLDDPHAFVEGIKQWLHPEGVWIVQFQDLWNMLACNGFDNVCHEHLLYLSAGPMARLLRSHGLQVEAMSNNDTNGGSLRIIAKHGPVETSPLSRANLEADREQLQVFARRVEQNKRDALIWLRDLKRQGMRVYGYGASTKGNTLLQYYGIGPDLVTAIADRNPDKWGKRTVGTNIPIISEDEMRAARPDFLLCLPWHFVEGFRQRERALLESGTQFIVPLPILRTLGLPEVDHANCEQRVSAAPVGANAAG